MEALTKRQRHALEAISRLSRKEARPPTTRELSQELHCHVKTVYQYIVILERKGYIERRKGRIYVTTGVQPDMSVPIVGQVAAGLPITAIENREGALSLEDLFGEEGIYAVRVEGDSMRDAGILDGDFVIVRGAHSIPSGRIAVCYVGEDQDVTVKKLIERNDCFELIPANPEYQLTQIPKNDPYFRVGGEVIGVVRSLR